MRHILVFAFILFGPSPSFAQASATSRAPLRPNILVLIIDEPGMNRIAIDQSHPDKDKTPHLHALATGGIRFDHTYASPKSGPSQLSLLTGRYSFRSREKRDHLSRQSIKLTRQPVSFATQLRDAGYKTAIAGTWHIGHIVDEGDRLSTVPPWGFDHRLVSKAPSETDTSPISLDRYTNFLIHFIETEHKKGSESTSPWLAFYSLQNGSPSESKPTKSPLQINESHSKRQSPADRALGKLVGSLDRLMLRENTLIIWIGQNAPIHGATILPTVPTSDAAGQGNHGLNDTATRVSFIANWPGCIKAGARSQALVDMCDIFPTCIELAGAKLPSDHVIDGKNMLPVLRGYDVAGRDWVWCESQSKWWIRTQDWKLYNDGTLFDMKSEPKEASPISPYSDSSIASQMRQWLHSSAQNLLKDKGKSLWIKNGIKKVQKVPFVSQNFKGVLPQLCPSCFNFG